MTGEPEPADDGLLAARLFAIDPVGTGGVSLRCGAGPERDRWLAALAALLPAGTPLKRAPVHVADERLLGGLDLAATLRAGRPVAERGLLADADGGILILAMAERQPAGRVARVTAVMDTGVILVERDGLALRLPSRFGVVALDEGIGEEQPAAALLDRLAFRVAPSAGGGGPIPHDRDAVVAARQRLAAVATGDSAIELLCAAGAALGIAGPRAAMLALAAARAHAALGGRTAIADEDLAAAARLVLAPRATQLPPEEMSPEEVPEAAKPQDGAVEDGEETKGAAADVVLEAARAAIPAGLMARLRSEAGRGRAAGAGRAANPQARATRGRPAGVCAGLPGRGERLAILDTLRAAAPWQGLRRRARPAAATGNARIVLSGEDFRSRRFKAPNRTTTIFAVDASGSSAMHRLAEAKGAVELLLADCYVRRDRVALIVFRNRGAEILLPPTRSVARARRDLARLPGGGGTPLAAGLETALELALAVRRDGQTPLVVLLCDGRPNVRRDGTGGRDGAEADALAAARRLRESGVAVLAIDTAPRPQPFGRALADAMGGRYLAMPKADAAAMSGAAATIRNRTGAPAFPAP